MAILILTVQGDKILFLWFDQSTSRMVGQGNNYSWYASYLPQNHLNEWINITFTHNEEGITKLYTNGVYHSEVSLNLTVYLVVDLA